MLKQHVLILNVLLVHVRSKSTTLYLSKLFLYLRLVPGVQNTGGGNTGMTNMYLMLAIWFAIAVLLFLFRPRTLRNNRDDLGKPTNQVRLKLMIYF
jgi:hypothetical protein